jgi:adenosine deaminase
LEIDLYDKIQSAILISTLMSALQKINEDMIVNLPKGDLHVHLNGAIPTNLVKELLAKNTNGIPSNFDINKDLNILEPQKNLQDYLKPWKVLNLIPRSQSDLNKIVLQTFFSLKRLCCINILQDTDF